MKRSVIGIASFAVLSTIGGQAGAADGREIYAKEKGAMPPRGGAKSLSDADIKAAVEYMVSQSK